MIFKLGNNNIETRRRISFRQKAAELSHTRWSCPADLLGTGLAYSVPCRWQHQCQYQGKDRFPDIGEGVQNLTGKQKEITVLRNQCLPDPTFDCKSSTINLCIKD
jgi:hypothetical protein